MVKPKKKRKPSQIQNSDDEGVAENFSEVIMPKVKRKPPLIGIVRSS